MPDGQGASHQIVNPEGLFCGLTFWAMPVPTAVVAVAYYSAMVTDFLVSSQGRCPANSYFAQYFDLQRC